MESSIVPGIYDESIADESVGAETEPAYEVARSLARSEGILAGHSSGAALFAVRELARGYLANPRVIVHARPLRPRPARAERE